METRADRVIHLHEVFNTIQYVNCPGFSGEQSSLPTRMSFASLSMTTDLQSASWRPVVPDRIEAKQHRRDQNCGKAWFRETPLVVFEGIYLVWNAEELCSDVLEGSSNHLFVTPGKTKNDVPSFESQLSSLIRSIQQNWGIAR